MAHPANEGCGTRRNPGNSPRKEEWAEAGAFLGAKTLDDEDSFAQHHEMSVAAGDAHQQVGIGVGVSKRLAANTSLIVTTQAPDTFGE